MFNERCNFIDRELNVNSKLCLIVIKTNQINFLIIYCFSLVLVVNNNLSNVFMGKGQKGKGFDRERVRYPLMGLTEL